MEEGAITACEALCGQEKWMRQRCYQFITLRLDARAHTHTHAHTIQFYLCEDLHKATELPGP